MIYKSTNIIDGSVYVGQTTLTLDERISHHMKDVKYNRYKSHFHSAIRKYGIDAFIWECLEDCDNSDLDIREQYWIAKYRMDEDCYNIQDGGGSSPSKVLKVPVDCYDEDGNHIGSFDGCRDASREFGIDASSISACVRGTRKYAGHRSGKKLLWCFKGGPTPTYKNWRSQFSVDAFDEDGNFIKRFETLKEGANFFGMKSPTGIVEVLKPNGRLRHSGYYNGKQVTWKRVPCV